MWEKIKDDQGSCHRMKVPGGWIIRSVLWMHSGVAVHQVFIFDPQHEWKLEK